MRTYDEPANKSIIVFENPVDMDVYFRDDELAEQADGEPEDERWFKVGEDDGPLCWESVLRSQSDFPPVTPMLLVRTPLGGTR